MQQTIAKGDLLQRIAGISFIVGAIILVVFNALFPRVSDPSYENTRAVLQNIADTGVGFVMVDNLLLAVGMWAIMIGVVGVYRSLPSGASAVWARLGFYGIVVGTTVWTVMFAIGGLAFPVVVEQWVRTPVEPAKTTMYLIASSLYRVDTSLFSMAIIVEWLALAFLSVGIVLSRLYPRWLGWAGLVLGVATVGAVGLPQAFAGPSFIVTSVLFLILSLLTTIWTLVLGVWIARRAW